MCVQDPEGQLPGNFFLYFFISVFCPATQSADETAAMINDWMQCGGAMFPPRRGKGRMAEIGLTAECQGVCLELTHLIRAPLLCRLF